ncbi:hypothetical protein K2173_014796 [Erythroxylum novogranatense]|uniref:Protein kinase domain-containing protein n=1 Tax=Erythroxylum novogranatense TaxID=1862640 RepID=A0AAV8TI61_9ROSI|nr:hypothetical protein K2173_014796 [Erythroxylum novogranatense]
MAFVNAIEVILAPDGFLSGDARYVNSTGSDGNYSALLSPALYKVHRLNVGGSVVTRENDILQRDWLTDDEFLLNPGNANNKSYHGYIYNGTFPSDFTPRSVYSTAKVLDTNRNKQSNLSNITWGFPVRKNAKHFVRVHFCDIVSDASSAAVKFNFHIYRNFSQKIDSSTVNTNLQTPFCLDYVVESDNSGFLNVTIDPRSESEIQNAYLNGLEIMEVMTTLGPAPPERMPKKNRLSVILGLLAGGLFAVISALALLGFRYKRGKQDQSSGRPFSLSFLGDSFQNLQAGITGKVPLSPELNLALKLPYWEIRRATKKFSSKLFIGKGGFGKVYRATLRGREVAIKRLEPGQGQGPEEFHNEIMLLSKIRHRHLVSLIGYCDDRSEMILVYERSELSWQQRLRICIDSARGLHYLHIDLERKIIHRDVKSTNILLTENYLAKVADFGISKSGALDHDQDINNTIKGSIGYIDPEYLMTLQLTEKSDVYSFGVVLLEVICARPVNIKSNIDEEMNLAEWGMHWQRKGELEKIIDPFLAGKINTNSLRKFGETAEKCLRPRGVDRPTMRDVLWDLILALEYQMYEEVCEDSIINLSQEYASLAAAGHLPSQSQNFQLGGEDYDGDSFIMPSGVFSQVSNEHGR